MANALSVVILTYNEEANLCHTLQSLVALDATVFVVDSGSTDRTRELAAAAGCKTVVHSFTNQADQLNWALDNLPLESEWIMRLDADERITPELVAELRSAIAEAPSDVTAFELKRRVYFWGRWIRHGGYYPTWLLRVWRRGTARSEQRWMDEHIVSLRGVTRRLEHDIVDENHKGIAFWVEKHNRYADREVQDLVDARAASAVPVTGQAARRRWLKTNVYGRTPLFARAFAYWVFRYILKLGFLDGVPGLMFHFNQGLWYRLLVDAKLYERARAESARGSSGQAPLV
jgi:glycosyltransferase involved in cell wall biosynthesis